MMFKKILLISSMFAASGYLSAEAAPVLSFSPSSQSISVGQESQVDIILSGSPGELLSAYNLTLTYDPAILENNGGDFFGINNAPDITGLETNQISWQDLGGPISVDLGSNSFTLASIYFQGLALGTSGLNFTLVDLNGLNATTTTANITVIPEPATMLLVALGALGLLAAPTRYGKADTN